MKRIMNSSALPINITTFGTEAAEEVQACGMDEDKFNLLYRRTARPLLGYLARISGDRALAEDLLQETYFRFLRAQVPPLTDVQLKSYLFRIATNLLRDYYRKAKRAGVAPAKDPTEMRLSPEVELRQDLGRVFERLSTRERQLLWLAHVEGLNHREIAEILGVRSWSVRAMVFRARRKAADLLRKKGLGPEVLR